MADPARRRRDGALGVVGAVTIGAVSAALVAPPALADEPDYPSWGDVQRAKADQAATQAEADRITGLLGTLQDRADAAGRTAAIAAERFHRARLAEDAARERHAALAASADRAQAVARTSRMRAGLLAASVARGGGEAELLLDSSHAEDFLHRLATVAQLSAQSQAIMQQAVTDGRVAEATGAQADAAATVLTRMAEQAQEALGAAQRAAAAAEDAVSTEQRHADRLVSQLADLRGTSVRIAEQYAAGVRAQQAEAAAAPHGGSSAGPSGGAPSGGGSSSGTPSSAPPATSAPVASPRPTPPDPVASSPVASSPVASGPVASGPVGSSSPSAGSPNSAQAAAAVAFARDQIGDAYRFGGAGPSSWDCSGLTMQAYASVGIGIGGHSATAQYDLARSEGRLAPYAQAQVGDLVFYTDGGGDMYHVAIYSGGGMMIEAPYPGVPVREVPVRSADRVNQVARPTAS